MKKGMCSVWGRAGVDPGSIWGQSGDDLWYHSTMMEVVKEVVLDAKIEVGLESIIYSVIEDIL